MSLQKQLVILLLFLFVVLGACGNDKPAPETNISNVVFAMTNQENKSFQVKHVVKGKDVLIECIVADFPFRKGTNGGHINVYVNGQKIDEVYTAAFMLRGLPTGKHVIRLELVHNDGKITGLSQEFTVAIS
ncbi:hypothetical protein [Parageobacillus sp. G301]|jgi:hypothetical protein|uniref:hypothetical protein n=1 Tax=Parageobacillus sp. G301 TaxID=2998290 RepID=UPI00255242C5|nr:hypothetical protein [Parageobacillus sp. G301]